MKAVRKGETGMRKQGVFMKYPKKIVAILIILMLAMPFTPITTIYAYVPAEAYKSAPEIPLNKTLEITNDIYSDSGDLFFDDIAKYYRIELKQKGSLNILVNGRMTSKYNNDDDGNWYFVLWDSSLNRLGSSGNNYMNTIQNKTIDFGTLNKGTYYLQVAASDLYYILSGDLTIKYVPSSVPQLNIKTTTTSKGSTVQLKMKNAPKGTIQWISGNKSVATVDKNGKVTAKNNGKAVIFAIINNTAYKCTIKVSD